MTVYSEEMLMALGSVMQASLHNAQPVHKIGSITGLAKSSINAPSTGQISMQAPHSGPLYGRHATVSMLAFANTGRDTE